MFGKVATGFPGLEANKGFLGTPGKLLPGKDAPKKPNEVPNTGSCNTNSSRLMPQLLRPASESFHMTRGTLATAKGQGGRLPPRLDIEGKTVSLSPKCLSLARRTGDRPALRFSVPTADTGELEGRKCFTRRDRWQRGLFCAPTEQNGSEESRKKIGRLHGLCNRPHADSRPFSQLPCDCPCNSQVVQVETCSLRSLLVLFFVPRAASSILQRQFQFRPASATLPGDKNTVRNVLFA